ncbi:hypothetical protein ABZU53_23475 [Micromonospora sp. NPDC005194]|uniref:hypothetical protein n=1 Tax=Micromonospora sp. NPDC005194 TaxID=3156870 RepID=UPI0033BC893E
MRLTRTYQALVSTVAAAAGAAFSPTRVPAASRVAATAASPDRQRGCGGAAG